MKRLVALILAVMLLLCGCASPREKLGQWGLDTAASVVYDPQSGALSLTPAEPPRGYQIQISVGGRSITAAGGMSFHLFETVSEWEPGKTYTESTDRQSMESISMALSLEKDGKYFAATTVEVDKAGLLTISQA